MHGLQSPHAACYARPVVGAPTSLMLPFCCAAGSLFLRQCTIGHWARWCRSVWSAGIAGTCMLLLHTCGDAMAVGGRSEDVVTRVGRTDWTIVMGGLQRHPGPCELRASGAAGHQAVACGGYSAWYGYWRQWLPPSQASGRPQGRLLLRCCRWVFSRPQNPAS